MSTVTTRMSYIGWCGTGRIKVHLPNGNTHDMPHQTMLLVVDREQMPGSIRVENLDYRPLTCSSVMVLDAHPRTNGYIFIGNEHGGWEMTPVSSDLEWMTL